MRSLIRLISRNVALPGEPAPVRRDPAPTKWGYRYQRLMLTPLFRRTVRIGLPVLLIMFVATAWFAKPENRDALTAQIDHIRYEIHHRPEFMVAEMEVIGTRPAVVAAIAEVIPVEFPVSSFDLDLSGMRETVIDLTAVKDAVLRVRPGGTLEINVTERRPVAVWRHVDGLRLIDAEGVMTGMIEARADRPDLPLIAGDGAMEHIGEAMALFHATGPVSDRVRGLVRMGERRWDIVLDAGQRILLPTENPVAALDRVIALHAAQDMLSRDVAVVDMRNGDRPTLRLSPLAAAAMRPTQTGAGQ